MSHALSVLLFWILSILGVPECEQTQGFERHGVCIEEPSAPSPPPPPARQPPGGTAVAISNGF
jgi:hypothetical protein